MEILKIVLLILFVFFIVTFAIYWFNLDTKLVKLIFPWMTKHYDTMKRDRRL